MELYTKLTKGLLFGKTFAHIHKILYELFVNTQKTS